MTREQLERLLKQYEVAILARHSALAQIGACNAGGDIPPDTMFERLNRSRDALKDLKSQIAAGVCHD